MCFIRIIIRFDVEKQEVIEIPVQSEMVPIKFMTDDHQRESAQENFRPKFAAKGYLPTEKSAPEESEPNESSPREEIPEDNSTTSLEEPVQEDLPKSDSVMEESIQRDSSLDANNVRSADQIDK